MGLPQWHMQTRRGDGQAVLPYPACTPKASAASLPMHSLYPRAPGSKTLPSGTYKWSAFLL